MSNKLAEQQTEAYITEENDQIPQLTLSEAKQEIFQILSIIRKSSAGPAPEINVRTLPLNPVLYVKILNSQTLDKGSSFTLTPQGLKSSKRRQNGIVYFGNKRKIKPAGEICNDFVIPAKDESLREPQFLIYFWESSYYLRDLGIGLGTFIRLKDNLMLTGHHLINIGDSYLYLTVMQEKDQNKEPGLSVKVYSELRIGEFQYFYAEDYYINEIYIGRGKNCTIILTDHLVSSHQLTIFYTSPKGWVLVDGDLSNHHPSTNGTW